MLLCVYVCKKETAARCRGGVRRGNGKREEKRRKEAAEGQVEERADGGGDQRAKVVRVSLKA